MFIISFIQRTTTKGHKKDSLLKRLVITHTDKDGYLSYSCIHPECGHHAAGNLQRAQILKHAVKCQHLRTHDFDTFQDAVNASATRHSAQAFREFSAFETI